MPTLREVLTAALQHYNAGRLDQAESLYLRLLAAQPGETNSLHMLGLIALRRKQPEVAVDYLRKVVDKSPEFVEGRSNLGAALQAAGRLDEAAECFEKLIVDAPQFATAWFNLGRVYKDLDALKKARDAYLRAIALDPRMAEAHSNLCMICRKLGRPEEAYASIQTAAALRPDFPDYRYAIGCVQRELLQIDAAADSFRRTLAMDPQHADAHRDLGFMLLTKGEYLEGWREHEWRFKCRDAVNPYPTPVQPMWDGSPLNGRSLFLVTEQGLGDAMLFIRYAPLIAERGGRIHLICPKELRRLFSRIPAIEKCYTTGDAIPICDVYVIAMSLPYLFRHTVETIPNRVPYLTPDAGEVAHWAGKLAPYAGKLKVGLTWSGNPKFMNDHHRSIAAEKFTPLGSAENVAFVSLQKSPRATPGFPLIDFTSELSDVADTAALVANLDLVITVDTAMCHLAGALAKPTWIFISHVPDARWLLDRTDSPWYPTARLFRQPARNDWDTPLAEAAAALRALSASPPSPPSSH